MTLKDYLAPVVSNLTQSTPTDDTLERRLKVSRVLYKKKMMNFEEDFSALCETSIYGVHLQSSFLHHPNLNQDNAEIVVKTTATHSEKPTKDVSRQPLSSRVESKGRALCIVNSESKDERTTGTMELYGFYAFVSAQSSLKALVISLSGIHQAKHIIIAHSFDTALRKYSMRKLRAKNHVPYIVASDKTTDIKEKDEKDISQEQLSSSILFAAIK